MDFGFGEHPKRLIPKIKGTIVAGIVLRLAVITPQPSCRQDEAL